MREELIWEERRTRKDRNIIIIPSSLGTGLWYGSYGVVYGWLWVVFFFSFLFFWSLANSTLLL